MTSSSVCMWYIVMAVIPKPFDIGISAFQNASIKMPMCTTCMHVEATNVCMWYIVMLVIPKLFDIEISAFQNAFHLLDIEVKFYFIPSLTITSRFHFVLLETITTLHLIGCNQCIIFVTWNSFMKISMIVPYCEHIKVVIHEFSLW